MTVTVSTVTATASTRARRREDASAPRPFPWNQSWRHARPSRRTRARAHRRDDREDDASPSDRVRSSTRAPSSSDARRHVGVIRNACVGTTRAPLHHTVGRPSPTAVVCRVMEHFGTRRVIATTPRAGAVRVPETRQRRVASDGNAWMEINGRVGIVARGAKVTHKCVSPNTCHHGDRHSPCADSHQAFTPAENQPSPSEQGT